MLNPAIGKLIKNYDNRYRLVVDISKKARKIAKAESESVEPSTEKPVSLAIDELANEKGL